MTSKKQNLQTLCTCHARLLRPRGPVLTVYIAAVTEREAPGGAAAGGEHSVCCKYPVVSAFACIRVALGPGAPYWFAKAVLDI